MPPRDRVMGELPTAPVPASGGGLTADEHAKLMECWASLKFLTDRMGG